jgi:hypothetical protein
VGTAHLNVGARSREPHMHQRNELTMS